MTDAIRVKGRHADAFPAKAAALRADFHPLGDRLVVRVTDDNHDDFWVEVDVPISDLRGLLDQVDDLLPVTEEQAEERLLREGGDAGCVDRFRYRRLAGRSVGRSYAEQFLELMQYRPMRVETGTDRYYWTCLTGDVRSKGRPRNDLPPWLFRLLERKALPEGASRRRASVSYPTPVAAYDHLADAIETLDNNPPFRTGEGTEITRQEEGGATAGNT